MSGPAQHLDAVDRAIEAGADDTFAFLERLVSARSTVGDEAAAQDVMAGELDRLGFAVSRMPVPERTAVHPAAGYLNQFGRPTLAYGPRARRTRLRQRARP